MLEGVHAAALNFNILCVYADAARASKEDVLLLYAEKWRQHIMQSCVSLACLLQVSDAAPLHAAIQAAWPFTDQVNLFHPCALYARIEVSCRSIGMLGQ